MQLANSLFVKFTNNWSDAPPLTVFRKKIILFFQRLTMRTIMALNMLESCINKKPDEEIFYATFYAKGRLIKQYLSLIHI